MDPNTRTQETSEEQTWPMQQRWWDLLIRIRWHKASRPREETVESP